MMKILILLFLIVPSLAFSQARKNHAEISDAFGDTIVSVNVAKKNGATHSGTGFIVHPSGVIATAGHVVEDAIFINLTFKNGAISDEAILLDITPNKQVDLALLKIDAKNLPYVIFQNSDHVKAGEEITVIGNPRRLQNTITSGLVSQLRQVSKGVIWQQISAPISPSSSGSPVFNSKGNVIGIALSSLKGSDNQNLNFAIPSNYLVQLMIDNNYKAAYEGKAQVVAPAAAKRNTLQQNSLLTDIKNHIKKSWYILKRRILRIK